MDRYQSPDGGGLSDQTEIIGIRPGREVVLLRIKKRARKKGCIENINLVYRTFCLLIISATPSIASMHATCIEAIEGVAVCYRHR